MSKRKVLTPHGFSAVQQRAFEKAVKDNINALIPAEAERLARKAVREFIKKNKEELDADLRKMVKEALDERLPEIVRDYLNKTTIGSYNY